MVRTGLTILSAVAASCCICLTVGWLTQPRTGVAVVDLDEVSRRLGRMTEMEQSVQSRASQNLQRLASLEKDASVQLQEARKVAESSVDPEMTKKFQRMQQSAVVQLNQLKQKADLDVNGHRQQLVSQFRDEVRPVVASVAKKHGFATVVTRNETFLFSFEKTVDITDEVTQLMAASGQTGKAEPATAAKPAVLTPSKEAAPADHVPAQAAKPAPQKIQQVKHEAP